MSFNVQDLLNVSCYCDVYRKRSKSEESDNREISMAETVVAEAKVSEVSQERSN